MRIGGELPIDKIEELRKIVTSEFSDLQYDEGFGIDNLKEVAAPGKSLFIQGSVNDGNPQATADFCRSNSLAFWLRYDAGYEWDAGIQIWKPGMDEFKECCASARGYGPMIDLTELRLYLARGDDLLTVVEALAPFEADAVPPLTITSNLKIPLAS
jgi:hypothetical protein